MSPCADELSRRVVEIGVEDGMPETYEFLSSPAADPFLTVSTEDTGIVNVVVELSSDGQTWAAAWGAGIGAGIGADAGATWTIPRSVAAIRCSSAGGSALFVVAILEQA